MKRGRERAREERSECECDTRAGRKARGERGIKRTRGKEKENQHNFSYRSSLRSFRFPLFLLLFSPAQSLSFSLSLAHSLSHSLSLILQNQHSSSLHFIHSFIPHFIPLHAPIPPFSLVGREIITMKGNGYWMESCWERRKERGMMTKELPGSE